MERLPLVTVVVPSYNHAEYVEQAIQGIIAQDYTSIELIVIDDGSSDESRLCIENLAGECRRRFSRFEFRARKNLGLCKTLNEALAWARGKYFVIADSDDVLLPEMVSTLLPAMEADDYLNGSFGGAFMINEAGKSLGIRQPLERRYAFSDILARNKHMTSSCGLLRTEAMRQAGGYLDDLYIEDWYMMLRLTERGSHLQIISQPLILYRIHSTNISKNTDKMVTARFQILNIFATYPGHAERSALVHVEASIDNWRASRRRAFSHLLSALNWQPKVIRRKQFWLALCRLLLPGWIVSALKTWKNSLPRAPQIQEVL